MDEKELMIKAIREKAKNIDNKNINDYKGFIRLILQFLSSDETDEKLWKELLSIGEKLLIDNLETKPFKIPYEISDNLNREYYDRNGYSFDELKYKVDSFENLSSEAKSIISFRIFAPEVLEPNYRPF